MEGVLNNKLNDWTISAIAQLKQDGLTQDIHVDELFIDEFKRFTRKQVLTQCYQLFCHLIKHIKENQLDTSNIDFMLTIDLESQSNVFLGLPVSQVNIEALIDTYSVPEIILYHDAKPREVPLTEFYRVPILFDPFIENENVTVFYKEYRLLEEMMSGGDYTREISIIYMQ